MPERFDFACFLLKPEMPSPQSAISGAVATFPDRIGSASKAMVLDVRSKRAVTQTWPAGRALLQKHPGPTELLFVYHSSLKTSGGYVCISFRRTTLAAELVVSLEDMAIADEDAEITEACLRLRCPGLGLASDCVVAAGGELGGDEMPGTPAQLLNTLMAPMSLARWIACDGARLPEDHFGFEVVCRSGATSVLHRSSDGPAHTVANRRVSSVRRVVRGT
jgi:hypothetical protein